MSFNVIQHSFKSVSHAYLKTFIITRKLQFTTSSRTINLNQFVLVAAARPFSQSLKVGEFHICSNANETRK
jgi:hypothetical protein